MFKYRKKSPKQRYAEAIEMIAARKGIPIGNVSLNMTVYDMKKLLALILKLPKNPKYRV